METDISKPEPHFYFHEGGKMKRLFLGLAVAAAILSASLSADAAVYRCYVIKGVSISGTGPGTSFLVGKPNCTELKRNMAPNGTVIQGDNLSCILNIDANNVLFCIP